MEICAGGRLRAAVALTTKGSGGEMWRHITSQASEAVLPSEGTPKKPVAGVDGGAFARLPDLCALSESRSLE